MLTDEQWQLVKPLLPPSPPSGRRGRPPLDQRMVLDAILIKLSRRIPWRKLHSLGFSYQVCYLHFRLWRDTGIMRKILLALLKDLEERGPFNLVEAERTGMVKVMKSNGRMVPYLNTSSARTWQTETALLFAQYAACLAELKQNGTLAPDPIVAAFNPHYRKKKVAEK